MKILRHQKGSALIMVIASIAILSILVFGLFQLFQQSSGIEIARSKAFQAKLLAESGIALGSHPEIFPEDKILSQEIRTAERFDVVIHSEESFLNINAMLQENNIAVLERLFKIWKIPQEDAAQLIARLQDWIDTDDLPRIGGAESADYEKINSPYRPANRLFSNIEEMRCVDGIEILDQHKPDWGNFFSIYGDGAIDINEASSDIIQAVCDVSAMDAERLIAKRSELDANGRHYRFKSLDEVRILLGIPQEQFQSIVPHLTLHGDIRRIESTGTCHELKHTTRAFIRWNGPTPITIRWDYLPNSFEK